MNFPIYGYVVGAVVIAIVVLLYIYKRAYATKIILFHSEKCQYCVKLMPEWKKLVSRARFSTKIRTIEVDVDKDAGAEKLKDNYDVKSWPTIIIIKDYKWTKYDDEENRQAEGTEKTYDENRRYVRCGC